MSLTVPVQKELLERGYSRRQIAKIALGAAAAIPLFHEFAFAQDDGAPSARGVMSSDVVRSRIPDPARRSPTWCPPSRRRRAVG